MTKPTKDSMYGVCSACGNYDSVPYENLCVMCVHAYTEQSEDHWKPKDPEVPKEVHATVDRGDDKVKGVWPKRWTPGDDPGPHDNPVDFSREYKGGPPPPNPPVIRLQIDLMGHPPLKMDFPNERAACMFIYHGLFDAQSDFVQILNLTTGGCLRGPIQRVVHKARTITLFEDFEVPPGVDNG